MTKHHDKNRENWANRLFNGGRNPKESVHTVVPNAAKTTVSVDKISKYGWVVKDSRGSYKSIDKNLLIVDHSYQRDCTAKKVRLLANAWSWIGCGAIVVGNRNGEYYVIDGQHRVMAAQTRSDIDTLDCMVFETRDDVVEAQGFVNCNIKRWKVSAIDTYRAQLKAQEPDALYLNKVLSDLDMIVSHKHAGPKTVGWVVTCYWMMRQSRPKFEQVMRLIKELSTENKVGVTENLARGLFYLNDKLTVDFDDKLLRERILDCTVKELDMAIRDAVVTSTVRGGSRIYAIGILNLLNKGRRTRKFTLKEV